MDTLAAVWERFADVVAVAVEGLPGWSFHRFPPDAADPPAAWIERAEQAISFDDANRADATLIVVGALANQPSVPTMRAELALIDAVTAATAPTAVNGLHRTDLRTDPPGRLELGGVAFRAVSVRVTLTYSLC